MEKKVVTEDCKAKIKGVSILGELTIKFNAPMKTDHFKLTDLNDTNIDIYVEPAEERHLVEGFKLASVNFTWDVIEFKEDTLRI